MITTATIDDIPELAELINSGYRGKASRKGWTTEADLIDGELRTDEADLKELLIKAGSMFLKFTVDGKILGCVYLQKQAGKMYLGMLTVSPAAQASGIGKEILSASEKFARQEGCDSIIMNVISIRHELIEWYERRGYMQTGKTNPFPTETKFGTPRLPIEFMVLEKKLV
jgi:ribosomal protein S18 acetylase RimI-like enzyme